MDRYELLLSPEQPDHLTNLYLLSFQSLNLLLLITPSTVTYFETVSFTNSVIGLLSIPLGAENSPIRFLSSILSCPGRTV